jgi:hypothetical protein
MLDWKALGVNTVIGYVVSWGLFFVLLRPFAAAFGTVQGAALNYGFSWVTWIGITWALQVFNPGGEA